MSIQYRSSLFSQAIPPTKASTGFSWDKLGASLSLACAVHCALQPILLMLLPVAGLGFLMNEQYETVFLAFSILLAAYSIVGGIKHHGQKQALPLLLLGTLSIVLSRVFESYEIGLAITGALSISLAHVYNMYLHKRVHNHS